MRALSTLPLDDDVVDRIFTFCPTFGTLQSLMLVSKAFHRVYQTHPKSITRAVLYNIVGPALPQALRVIRFQYNPLHGAQDDPDTLATRCPEDHDLTVITAIEKQQLQQNSKLIASLEDIYSLTQKDRTSRISVLTADESWRFRRAAYRIMFYCTLFSASGDDVDEDEIKPIQRQRTAVLMEYPTDELFQLYSIVRFFRSILEHCNEEEANPPHVVDVLLTLGPGGVKRAWDYRECQNLLDDIDLDWDHDLAHPLYTGYFSVPLDKIWVTRKVKPPKDDEPATKYILDTIIGANDTCSQCAAPGGIALLTQANWHRALLFPAHLLKGRLKQDSAMLMHLSVAIQDCHDGSDDDSDSDIWEDADANLGPWIARVFGVPKTSEWDGWTKDQSYCLSCLTKFLEEHSWRWLLQERITGGWSPPPDCWYGYNCRTMVHNSTHANKLNHLCVPTRGDI
ncbi:hypothetical protein C8R45DRAFT_990998 [Mycena sanguinolenta]|nr:hypothetical protein C8R45DRAFT_990998 [Mycena sanguinolenta]